MLLRERAGLTQKQLASQIGKSDQAVSDWERGKSTPRLSFAKTLKLTKLLNCSLEDLVEAFPDED